MTKSVVSFFGDDQTVVQALDNTYSDSLRSELKIIKTKLANIASVKTCGSIFYQRVLVRINMARKSISKFGNNKPNEVIFLACT